MIDRPLHERFPWLPPTLIFLGFIGLLAFATWLSEVFMPLGAGLVLAFVLAPLVQRLTKFVGTRTRAAALLLLSFFVLVSACLGVAIPTVIGEVRHLTYAVAGEGAANLGELKDTVAYGAFADAEATNWDYVALSSQAKLRGAPPEVVRILQRVPAPDVHGDETLAEALGDHDGDGRLEPGYIAKIRTLAKDRTSWLGMLTSKLEKAGILKDLDKLLHGQTDKLQWKKWLDSSTLSTAGDMGLRVLGSVGHAVSRAIAVALATVLVPVYAFFFLLAMPRWREHVPLYLPHRSRQRSLYVLKRIVDSIAAFVRGRVVVCGIVGIVTALGWLILGVRMGFLAGLLVGVLTVIPLANLLVFVPVILLCLLDLGSGVHGAGWVLGVLAVYAIGQIAESVLNPIIVGDAVSLDMVTMIVSLFIGGTIAGFLGLLLAVPVAATLKILAEELLLPRWRAWANPATAGEVVPPPPVDE